MDGLPHRRRGQVTWRELAVRLYTGSPRTLPLEGAARDRGRRALHAGGRLRLRGAARRRHLRRLAHPGRGWLLQRRAHLPLAGAREPHRRGGGLPLGRPRHRHHLRPTHGRRSGSAPRALHRGHAHRGTRALHRASPQGFRQAPDRRRHRALRRARGAHGRELPPLRARVSARGSGPALHGRRGAPRAHPLRERQGPAPGCYALRFCAPPVPTRTPSWRTTCA